MRDSLAFHFLSALIDFLYYVLKNFQFSGGNLMDLYRKLHSTDVLTVINWAEARHFLKLFFHSILANRFRHRAHAFPGNGLGDNENNKFYSNRTIHWFMQT